jgi:gas vesicle protein
MNDRNSFKRSSKLLIFKGLFLGALLGGAVGAYLNSEKGEVIRKLIKKNVKTIFEEISKRSKRIDIESLMDMVRKEVRKAIN